MTIQSLFARLRSNALNHAGTAAQESHVLSSPRGLLALPSAIQWPRPFFLLVQGVLLVLTLCMLPTWKIGIQKFLHSGTYSDVYRQWACCDYVRHGYNPFESALAALQSTYGPVQGPDRVRLKDTRIWSVNMTQYDDSTPGIMPGTPPPEAGYAPSSLAICLALFGYLSPSALLPFWVVVNAVCLFGVILFLAWPAGRSSWKSILASLLFVSTVFVAWPTTYMVFENGQFTFFALLTALIGLHLREKHPWLASVFFSLALIKPALLLLFFIIPFVERNWRLFVGVAVIQVLLTLWISWLVQTAPWVLIAQWMEICRYLLQGSFTFQEIYNAMGWENTWIQTALTLVFFAYCLGMVIWTGKRHFAAAFCLLCYANLLWTYHERHDFLLLLFPMLLVILHTMQHPPSWKLALNGLAFVGLISFVGAGLSNVFYVNVQPVGHAMRWAARLGIMTTFVWTNLVLWRGALDDRTHRQTDLTARSAV